MLAPRFTCWFTVRKSGLRLLTCTYPIVYRIWQANQPQFRFAGARWQNFVQLWLQVDSSTTRYVSFYLENQALAVPDQDMARVRSRVSPPNSGSDRYLRRLHHLAPQTLLTTQVLRQGHVRVSLRRGICSSTAAQDGGRPYPASILLL